MDLAAESRVKLARNNKVPRLGGIDAPLFPWSDFFIFPEEPYYDVRPRRPIYTLVIGRFSFNALQPQKARTSISFNVETYNSDIH